MIEIRENEPDYAKLNDPSSQSHNRYGQSIQTVEKDDALRGKSLNINGDVQVGDNPNRYKQHGFFFNADNCIACHACETACSEKNDVSSHMAFRSVGFVEGGTYPAYQRINISMACNHCDDPVCLKGCPTRAYTKFAEYGAVLQDPDICFGCGYCTWVCPYNAPQLDPVKGEVSKCNMCVDRLEVGLKPACVSACLGKALDFGVIENIPDGHQQAQTQIPGFPRADITRPNIRFEQTKDTEREMTRSDSMPIKYHRDDKGDFQAALDEKHGQARQWNWNKLLRSHESSHMIFTLNVQAAMGAFMVLMLGSWMSIEGAIKVINSSTSMVLFGVMIALMSVGLFKLNMHLGKPHRFYRGFNNLRHSPVSREIAGISGFFMGLIATAALVFMNSIWPSLWQAYAINTVAVLTLISGLIGLYYMIRLYLIPARPFWNHWQTSTAFVGSVISLGALMMGWVAAAFQPISQNLISNLCLLVLAGVLLESVGHWFHGRDLSTSNDEGAASHYLQRTQFGYPWLIRNGLLMATILMLLIALIFGLQGLGGAFLAGLMTVSLLVSAIISRSLFYAIVIPTTLPGAFFWKNQGFKEHAQQTGLANMPQLGVEEERHHAFDWEALIQTAKQTLSR